MTDRAERHAAVTAARRAVDAMAKLPTGEAMQLVGVVLAQILQHLPPDDRDDMLDVALHSAWTPITDA